MSGVDPRDAEDIAWLDARETQASVLPPIDAARATAYDQLQALVAALPDEPAPQGWQEDVMAALSSARRGDAAASQVGLAVDASVEGAQTPSPASDALANGKLSISPAKPRIAAVHHGRRRWNPPAAAVAAIVAAAAGLLLWAQRPPAPVSDPDEGTPSTRIVRVEGSRHGDSTSEAAIGDSLLVEVTAVVGSELRIYRDDREVVLRCPGPAGCTHGSGRLMAELHIRSPGRYRALHLLPVRSGPKKVPESAPTPSSPPTGTLEGDLAACHCASRAAVPIVAR